MTGRVDVAPTWSDLVRTSADRINDPLAARRVVEEAAGCGAAGLVLVGDAFARPDALDHVCSMLARSSPVRRSGSSAGKPRATRSAFV